VKQAKRRIIAFRGKTVRLGECAGFGCEVAKRDHADIGQLCVLNLPHSPKKMPCGIAIETDNKQDIQQKNSPQPTIFLPQNTSCKQTEETDYANPEKNIKQY
jgi:hypothetical protein